LPSQLPPFRSELNAISVPLQQTVGPADAEDPESLSPLHEEITSNDGTNHPADKNLRFMRRYSFADLKRARFPKGSLH